MANEKEVKLKISAETDGSDKIHRLAEKIYTLAKNGGDAAPVFQKLGQELEEIANQQKLVAQFADLKNKTLETTAAMEAATDASRAAAIALRERQKDLAAVATQEQRSAEAVAGYKQAIENANIGLRATKAEIDAYNAAIAKTKSATAEQSAGLERANIQLREYKAAISAAKAGLDEALPVQRENAAALKQAQAAADGAATAFEKNRKESAALKSEFGQANAALQSVRDKMTEAGAASHDLAAAQIKIRSAAQGIADAFNAEKSALEARNAAERAATEALRQADAAYRQKVATLKADAQIEAEVINLAKTQNQIAIETARNTQAVARAKGDEKAVSEAMRNIRQLENSQARLTAEGLRAEANAEESLTTAKRDHLASTNRLTSAVQAEIVAEKTATESKRALAAATEEAAKRQVNLADHTEKSGSAIASLAGFARSAIAPIAGFVAAFAGVSEFVRVNIELENISRSLRIITGSSDGARKEMGFLKQASNDLGLELVGTAKAYAQFSAATKGSALEGEQTRKVFLAVANAMVVAGRSMAETEGALNALGQMVSKGVVQMEELRGQLGDRLPGALKLAADASGLTSAQLIKMVENGEVLAEDLLPKLADALNKTFKESADAAKTTTQEFNKFRNAVSESFADLGETGILKGLIVVGNALGTVTTGAVTLSGTLLTTLGAAIATTSTMLFDFGRALVTLDFSRLLNDWRDSIRAFKETVEESFDKSATAIRRFRDQLPGMGKDVKDASDAVGAIGKAAEQTSSMMGKSAVEIAIAEKNWGKLNGAYIKAIQSSKNLVTVAEKNVEARKAEADEIKRLAELSGSETAKRNAAVESAKIEQEAIRGLALTRTTELQVLENQLAARKKYIEVNKDASKEKAKQIEDLSKEIAVLKKVVEGTQEHAAATKIATAQAQAEAEALKDNSARTAEFKTRVAELTREVERLTLAKRAGQDVDEKLAAAKTRLAAAVRLEQDALEDQARLIAASNEQRQAENNLQQLTVKLAIEEQKTALEVAKAKGDEAGVRRASNEIRKLETELAHLQAEALRAEADAALEMLKVQREEILATRELTKAEEAQFKARELGAQARKKQADIADQVAKRMEKLNEVSAASTQHHKNLAKSADGVSDAYGRMGDSAESSAKRMAGGTMGMVGALETLGDRISITRDRYKGLTEEQAKMERASDEAINDMIDATRRLDAALGNNHGVTVLADQVGRLSDKLEEAARNAKKLELAAKGIEKTVSGNHYNKNKELSDENGNKITLNGNPDPWLDSDGNWYYTDESGQLRRSQGEPTKDSKGNWRAAGSAGMAGQDGAPTTNTGGGLRSYTVNITLGGSTTQVGVASEKDAQALTSLLGQISSDKARTI